MGIGIKLADGAFYPILQEGTAAHASVCLTTARDNQDAAHICLYRSADDTMKNAEYAGSLQIKVPPHPEGEPNLRLDISLDENNRLQASVTDTETETSVQLNADGAFSGNLSDTAPENFFNNSFENENALLVGLYDNNNSAAKKIADTEWEKDKKKRIRLATIVCVLCAIMCAAIFVLFLFVVPSRMNIRGSKTEEEISRVEEIVEAPVISAPVAEPPKIIQIAETEELIIDASAAAAPIAEAPVTSAPVIEPPRIPPAAQTSSPIRHTVRRGETLWSIAWVYYRDPWRYTYIARYNGIKNPNKITSGTVILIPRK